MRRFVLGLAVTMVAMLSYAQTTIKMENSGGIYRIPCLVNGAKMKFVFDTGASTVSLSLSMAQYLLDNDYISASDFKGKGQTVVATGEVIDHLELTLKDIEIAGLHLRNVEATVIDAQNAPLLLGQTAIQKLGRIELNGDMLTIIESNSISDLTDAEIDQMFELAWDYYTNKRYGKAAEIYSQLYQLNILSDWGKGILATCLCWSDNTDYDYAITVLNSVTTYTDDMYSRYGEAYAGKKDRESALYYYRKATESNDWACQYLSYWGIAEIYRWGEDYGKYNDYDSAYDNYCNAIDCIEKHFYLPKNYLFRDCYGELERGQRSYRTECSAIENLVYNVVLMCWFSDKWSNEEVKNSMKALAKNGNEKAIKLCNKNAW